jgi:broad specificity phosphatase PhoE
MPTVTFIRHGESESNAGLRTEHPATIRLTAKGQRQAELTAESFQCAPDLIVTSPYLRTRQTAEPLLQRFPATPTLEWPVQEFTYLDPQHWNGTTWQERQPAAHAYWERLDPAYRDGGVAESWFDLIARIDQTRQLILSQPAAQIVIFSHGLFTRSFWWRLAQPGLIPNAENMRRYASFIRGIAIPNCARLQFHLEEDQTWVSALDFSKLLPELLSY